MKEIWWLHQHGQEGGDTSLFCNPGPILSLDLAAPHPCCLPQGKRQAPSTLRRQYGPGMSQKEAFTNPAEFSLPMVTSSCNVTLTKKSLFYNVFLKDPFPNNDVDLK
jgi:hypothetical protein